jgi:hypothetical protein
MSKRDQEMHTASAEHFAKMGKSLHAMAKCFKARDGFAQEAQHADDMGDSCDKVSAYHASCSKAAGDELNKIVPDSVRGVIPSDVPTVTAVPRTGQPSLAKTLTANVDPKFHSMLAGDLTDEF